MKINILTLHFETDAWLEIQKRHILKNTPNIEYKLWLAKYKLELPKDFELPDNWEVIDLDELYPQSAPNEHYHQIQWMYDNCVKENMEDDDIIIFMDNDAFPISPKWLHTIKQNLDGTLKFEDDTSPEALCLIMPENRGIFQPEEYYPYPDLCFFATTKGLWKEKQLEWTLITPEPMYAGSKDNNYVVPMYLGQQAGNPNSLWIADYDFKNAPGSETSLYVDSEGNHIKGYMHQNPGFGMFDRLAYGKVVTATLSRTNKFNSHPVMFGVYGDIIYHQQCGSRALIGRPYATRDPNAKPTRERQCYTGQDLYGRRSMGQEKIKNFETECKNIIDTNTQIFDIIYNKIKEDAECTFIREFFMGVE